MSLKQEVTDGERKLKKKLVWGKGSGRQKMTTDVALKSLKIVGDRQA